MRILPKLGVTAATVMCSAGLILPFASPASSSTACAAPKGGSCQHAVHHKAGHRKAEHHSKGEHHSRHHEHHKSCHEHHHDDHEQDD